jgi:hypothetical protein
VSFEPTGKQLAELAKAAKCHANMFKEGAGKEALDAIVAAAIAAAVPEGEAGEQTDDKPKHSPAKCWRCGGRDWQYQQHEQSRTTVICIACGTKCVTPKM